MSQSKPETFEDTVATIQAMLAEGAPPVDRMRLDRALATLAGSRTGVMGDLEILAAMERGQVLIEPFDRDLLGSSSYDVRLGGNYYIADIGTLNPVFSPFDEDSVRDYYKGPHRATTAREFCDTYGWADFPGIDPSELIIVLRPGECILAHTAEYIGAAYGATTMMKAKSSIGRINVSACDDAGWGDVGYVNRWTFEVRNKNKTPIVLVVGMPIAQMVFLWVQGASINYGETGHYQLGVDLEEVKKTPITDNMLPKLWTPKSANRRRRLTADQLF